VLYTYDAVNAVDTVSGAGGVGVSKRFRAWQRMGAPAPGTGGSEASPARASFVDSARTIVSWPRGAIRDSAFFRVDPFGEPVELRRPASAIVLIDRDSAGRPTHMLSSTRAEMWQVYDANGNLIRSIARVLGGATEPNSIRYDTTRYEYHTQWQSMTKVVQPERDSTLFGYDEYGRRITVTDGMGRQTAFAWTARGQMQSIAEPHPSGSGE